MKYWKDLEKHGRHGDTMMKKIDGDLAHVNAVEYEMSEEWIKEHGSGTTNPITGKKEYILPALAIAGIGAGIGAIGGWMKSKAQSRHAARVKAAAIELEKEQQALADRSQALQTESAKASFSSGSENIGIGSTMAVKNIMEGNEQTSSKIGFAGSAGVEYKKSEMMENVNTMFKSKVDMLTDTRTLAIKRAEIGKDRAYMSAEREKESLIAGAPAGNMGMDILSGAMSGFQTGASLGSSLQPTQPPKV